MRLLISFILIVILSLGCEEINSTLDNPYDVQSAIYSGNIPLITGIESVESNPGTQSMFGAIVKINWKDSSSNASGYLIQRSNDNVNFADIAFVNNHTFSYTDTCSDYRAFRYYRIFTKTASNISPPSPVKKVSLACGMNLLSTIPVISGAEICNQIIFSSEFNINAVLYTQNSHYNIAVINMESGAVMHAIPDITDYGGSMAVAFSPDGRYLAYVYERNRYVYLVDMANGYTQTRVAIPNSYVEKIALSHDNSRIFLSGEFSFDVVEIQSGQTLYTTSAKSTLYFSSDTKKIVFIAGQFFTVQDTDTWSILNRVDPPEDYDYGWAKFDYDNENLIIFGATYSHIGQYDFGTKTFAFVGSGSNKAEPRVTTDGKFIFYDNTSGYTTKLLVKYRNIDNGDIVFQTVSSNMLSNKGMMNFYPNNVGRYISKATGECYQFHFRWE